MLIHIAAFALMQAWFRIQKPFSSTCTFASEQNLDSEWAVNTSKIQLLLASMLDRLSLKYSAIFMRQGHLSRNKS